MKNIIKLSIVAIFAYSFIPNVLADDFPTIKSGYWQTVSTDGIKMKHCVDSSSLKDLFEKSSAMMNGSCSKLKIYKKGSAFISEAVCKMLGTVMTIVSETSGDFNKEYVTKTTTKYNPAFMGRTKDTSTVTSKLLSDKCPEGVKPGDIETSDGIKINANEMVENMPDMKSVNKMMENMPDIGNPKSNCR